MQAGRSGLLRALLLAIPLLLHACVDLGDPAVVVMTGDNLSLSDLRRAYAGLDPVARGSLATREQRSAFVDELIRRRLLLAEGERLLAAGEEQTRDRLIRGREDLLVQRLRVIQEGFRSVSPEEVREAHRRMGWSHRVEIVSFRGAEEARAARRRIEAGDSFETVARSGIGGRIVPGRWMSWAPFPDPLVDAAAYLEIGEISSPISKDGLHYLVRVTERRPQNVPPLSDSEALIGQGLRFRRQIESDREVGRRLLEAAGFRVHPDVIKWLDRRTREAIFSPGVSEQDPAWGIPRISADEESRVVADWEGAPPWTAGDYRDKLRGMGPGKRPRMGPLDLQIRRVAEGEATHRLRLETARRRGLEEDWWFQRSYARFHEDRLIQLALRRIESPKPADDAQIDSLITVIRESQPDYFQRRMSARVLRFDLPTREAALRERDRIEEAGGGIARLDEILTGDPTFEGSYHISIVTAGSLGPAEMEAAIFEQEPGTRTGPHRLSDTWIIMECLERIPPADLTDENLREQVRRMVSSRRDIGLVLEWVRARREELQVRIDEEALDALGPGM
jgi:hypothetical protein